MWFIITVFSYLGVQSDSVGGWRLALPTRKFIWLTTFIRTKVCGEPGVSVFRGEREDQCRCSGGFPRSRIEGLSSRESEVTDSDQLPRRFSIRQNYGQLRRQRVWRRGHSERHIPCSPCRAIYHLQIGFPRRKVGVVRAEGIALPYTHLRVLYSGTILHDTLTVLSP